MGGGIFGVTAALELRARGHQVRLLEAQTLPAPSASSTDISKVLRMEYGANAFYTELMERAFEGWRAWNERFEREGPGPLFHQTGIALLAQQPMTEGGFEHDSYQLLQSRGHPLERLNAQDIVQRFPAWAQAGFQDGFFNPLGGFAQSGRVVGALAQQARSAGVIIDEQRPAARLCVQGDRVTGVYDQAGARIEADTTLIAAGAWTPLLLPKLKAVLRTSGHPLFHLRPPDPALFEAARFPVFCADVTKTGVYGFPMHPEAKVLKLAFHGEGLQRAADEPLEVGPAQVEALRAFLKRFLPTLEEAEIVATRLCLYCDSPDGDFWIGSDPDHRGLVVASGGSGHGFKFAPVLGALSADAVEGRLSPQLERLSRPASQRSGAKNDAARASDQNS